MLFLVERPLPGAHKYKRAEIDALISRAMQISESDYGPDFCWFETYIVEDRFLCLYDAPSEDAIREHSRTGDFPITRIDKVSCVVESEYASLMGRRGSDRRIRLNSREVAD
jgi:hypothetical protein